SVAPKPADAKSAPLRAKSQRIAAAGTSNASSIAAHGQPSEKELPEACHGKSAASPPKTATPPSDSSAQRGITALEPGIICPDSLIANKTPPHARIAEMPPSWSGVIM